MFRSFPCDRQLDLMDCGPACIKMIAKYYGKYYSLQFLRSQCGLTREGVSLLDLSYAAEYIGLRCISFKCSVDDIITKVPLPAILHWQHNHFVVVYKTNVNRDSIFISDPAKGLIKYSKVEFSKKWKSSEELGTVMAIEPNTDFFLNRDVDRKNHETTFNSIFSYFKPYKSKFYNLFFIMLVATFLQGILPFIAKAVIDVGIQSSDIKFINLVLIANISIYIAILLSNLIRDWILLHITSRINIALISDYLIKLMSLPISFFENKMTGDILQRAADHERIRAFIMNNSLNMFFSGLTFLVFGGILFFYNITIFYIFLLGSILFILWIFGFLKLRQKLDWEYFELISQNQSYWVEIIDSMQDIKLNNYEKQKRWKWERIQAKLYHVNIRSLNINNLQTSGAQFIDNIKNLSIVFFCAKEVIKGEMTFGVMISTQFIIGILNAPIFQFIQFIIGYQFAKISFLRLNEIHKLADETSDKGDMIIDMPITGNINIKNVSFQYSSSMPFILKNVTITIPEKKVTAIVGDSGSGKSTLLKIILRLYNPTNGDIFINDKNVNYIGLKQWREKCGVVLQDSKIFNDTILNHYCPVKK